MDWPSADLINALFEPGAALMILNHCRVLYEDKIARGVSALIIAFMTTWGVWHLLYYHRLEQPISYVG